MSLDPLLLAAALATPALVPVLIRQAVTLPWGVVVAFSLSVSLIAVDWLGWLLLGCPERRC
jgi:hypothetical protein